jgi:DNA ligase-1
MEEIKLFRKTQLGIGTWRIWGKIDDARRGTLYYAHASSESASEVQHADRIELNASGRDIEEQMILERNSRLSRQLDKGYKFTPEEAALGSTNQLGLLNPMLAQSLDKVRNVNLSSAFVQPKLDGHRCLITNQGGAIFAYTRKGKPIDTIPHILEDFRWLAEGKTVDGELYIHGRKLQTISSFIKRMQPASSELRYHWYDYAHPTPFAKRIEAIHYAAEIKQMPHVDVVETARIETLDEVYKLFRRYRDEGYEGAMLRVGESGYQPSVRAAQLLKVKERHDCEVTVLGATPSREGWAVLRVRTDEGREFDVSAPGSVPQKRETMDNIDKYVGRRLTIEYAHLTEEQIPFHAVALRWRDDV